MRGGEVFSVVALACAALTVCALRFVGRDRVVGVGGRERRVEIERLARTVTPSATPPEDLTPAQGGVLRTERVDERHKVAWLLTAAADGHVTIHGVKHPILRRRASGARMDPEVRDVLRRIFAGRNGLTLGTRDQSFRQGWEDLSRKLADWRTTSGLWDMTARQLVLRWRAVHLSALLLGLALAITGGILTGHRIVAGLPVLLAGAVVAGLGVAVAVRSWELDRRTPRGSALWLQVEAFRRYLADPSTCPDDLPVGEQADRHAAWAVALGVESAWEQAISATTSRPPAERPFSLDITDVLLASVVLSAASPPSSSGGSSSSGGGGSTSGGVGGGAGGGGGGSW
jgi:uncharacterized membrane protein YgcG